MSCIAYVWKRYDDVDFDRERYVPINDFEAFLFYCQNEVPGICRNIFGVVDGLVTAYDRTVFLFL